MKSCKSPDRNEEQEEIIEGLIEELEEELEELKKEGEAIGAEVKAVKGNDKKAALELIDKNFREEIRRLKAIRDRLIKKNGPGDIILAEQMDKNIRQLEDLFLKANEEVNSEEETM
ncbi:hypothetical protein [Ekhidna sp.]|uniref:hypothetical protein n=1 Tax=Ekhidna sp. TaxID=2608089 RepID=UPI00329761AD